MDNIKRIIQAGGKSGMTEKQFLETEIKKFKKSPARMEMIKGLKYYNYEHDILQRKRTVIGKDGTLTEVENLPNNKVVDNQYGKMVDQKKNYLLGKPLTFSTENDKYEKALKSVFSKKFHRTLKAVGEDSLNGGIGWLYPYYSDNGEMLFKKFDPFEILPFWSDSEHTILQFAVRIYEIEAYEGTKEKIIEKVEVYSTNGIERYILDGTTLVADVENPSSAYVVLGEADAAEAFNWDRIPLIPFKCNSKEIPLIRRVKSLQDGINIMLSDFENNMQEDSRNTILVIKNYDGANLGEFRHNLSTYGAVKVKTVEGAEGGVDTLTVEVNSENYKAILEIFKKALIENARGYDSKDERMGGTPNQMNIQSMYNDIDLDANEMETEFQAAFEDLLYFVDAHLANSGQGDFSNDDVEIIFNRDMMMNETEIIGSLASLGVEISNETLIEQVPFINDVAKEQKRLEDQKKKSMEDYVGSFNPIVPTTTDPEGGEE